MRSRAPLLFFALAALGCSKDAVVTAEPTAPSAASASSAAPTPSATASADTPSAAPHAWVDVAQAEQLLSAPAEGNENAFRVLDLVEQEFGRDGVPATVSCYESLAYFALNQVTAGSVVSERCSARLPSADRAAWKIRFDAAQAAAEKRVAQTISDQVKRDCAAEVASLAGDGKGIGGCQNCMKVGDFQTHLLEKPPALSRSAVERLNPNILLRRAHP